jgi:hypothetical protein
MIELRMNISINDGEFIKSYDKTIQNRGYHEYYEIDLSEYSIDTILRLQVVNNYITKKFNFVYDSDKKKLTIINIGYFYRDSIIYIDYLSVVDERDLKIKQLLN